MTKTDFSWAPSTDAETETWDSIMMLSLVIKMSCGRNSTENVQDNMHIYISTWWVLWTSHFLAIYHVSYHMLWFKLHKSHERHWEVTLYSTNHRNTNVIIKYHSYLRARALVGVFPRLQRTGTQRRQLGLKHGDAASGGRHELEGGLKRRAEGAVGLSALAEHGWQRRQQVLHQLEEGGIRREGV